MPLELNQNNILKYLNEKGLKPELEKQSDQIYINMEIKGFDVPVFIGVISEGALLQLVAYLPYQLQEKTYGEVARLFHLLNKELDMPGFGMDEKANLMFYRCVIPSLNGKIEEEFINLYLGTARVACESFMHAIGLIVSGGTTLDDLLKDREKNG